MDVLQVTLNLFVLATSQDFSLQQIFKLSIENPLLKFFSSYQRTAIIVVDFFWFIFSLILDNSLSTFEHKFSYEVSLRPHVHNSLNIKIINFELYDDTN